MLSKMTAPTPTVRFLLAACLAVAATMASGGDAFAADGPEAEPAAAAQPERPRNRPDFLFGQPRGFAGFSAGWLRASSGGVFDWFRGYLITGVDAQGEFIPISKRAYDTAVFRFAGGYSITRGSTSCSTSLRQTPSRPRSTRSSRKAAGRSPSRPRCGRYR